MQIVLPDTIKKSTSRYTHHSNDQNGSGTGFLREYKDSVRKNQKTADGYK